MSPDQPGTGVCEICHRTTKHYRADGGGEPHFTADCTRCHDHREHFEVVVDDDNCTLCHVAEGTEFAKPSGHHDAFSKCSACHAEVAAAPGMGHRRVPACTDCHDQATHSPAGDAPRACTDCHSPHGSDNIALVLETITTPAGGPRTVRFDNLAGRADGSFASLSMPGTGVCEICHTTTRFYRADGTGEPHLTTDCLSCHSHAGGFEPLVSDATCTICHVEQGRRFEKPSRHSATFTACSECHVEVSPAPGVGHRAIPACSACHDQAVHAPTGPGSNCRDCHEPHGTDNIELVLEQITIPSGGTPPVRFDSRSGRADGSFASLSMPGTGVCEICHTTTAHYRADGTGAPHFTLPCYPCHTHERGFQPPPP